MKDRCFIIVSLKWKMVSRSFHRTQFTHFNVIPYAWSKRNDARNEIRLSKNCFDTRSRGRYPDNSGWDVVFSRLHFHPSAPRLLEPQDASRPHSRQYSKSCVRNSLDDGVVRTSVGNHSANVGCDAPDKSESAEDLGRTHAGLLHLELLRPRRFHRWGDSGYSWGHIDPTMETAHRVA